MILVVYFLLSSYSKYSDCIIVKNYLSIYTTLKLSKKLNEFIDYLLQFNFYLKYIMEKINFLAFKDDLI